MSNVITYPFKKDQINRIKEKPHGIDWPVVYLIEDGKEMYIGETTSLFNRVKDHFKKPDRRKLKKLHYITDDEFNKSSTLDIESWLIQYIAADGKFVLQNSNAGLQNHSYYEREKYKAKFETTWEKLQECSIVKHDLIQIRNSDLFKYSPYKSLSEEQLVIAEEIKESIKKGVGDDTYLIEGKPGTGKTILAVYLIKLLKDLDETKDLKVGLVVSMVSLRSTLKKVFKNISNLKAGMVVGPSQVVGGDYNLLIVDEAHRLKQRKGITNYGTFDKNNKKLGLGKEGTQLDWILQSSKKQVFLYDKNQTVRPADIDQHRFDNLEAKKLVLENQLRVMGGKEYINMINNIFEGVDEKYDVTGYDFRIYDDLEEMVLDIKKRNKEYGLARVVAGYAWPWKSKNNKNEYDIEIDSVKMKWNSTTQNWVNSENAVNEVGCIHTVQGYDLNYAGVIIGPDIEFDSKSSEFVINKGNYHDKKGFHGIEDKDELRRYIINIYKTLLTRGIKGTYVYVVNKELKEQLKKYFG